VLRGKEKEGLSRCLYMKIQTETLKEWKHLFSCLKADQPQPNIFALAAKVLCLQHWPLA
jgi:hypothetical protein